MTREEIEVFIRKAMSNQITDEQVIAVADKWEATLNEIYDEITTESRKSSSLGFFD